MQGGSTLRPLDQSAPGDSSPPTPLNTRKRPSDTMFDQSPAAPKKPRQLKKVSHPVSLNMPYEIDDETLADIKRPTDAEAPTTTSTCSYSGSGFCCTSWMWAARERASSRPFGSPCFPPPTIPQPRFRSEPHYRYATMLWSYLELLYGSASERKGPSLARTHEQQPLCSCRPVPNYLTSSFH